MTKKNTFRKTERGATLDRRGFLAGAAALGLTVVEPQAVRGSQANSRIELGMIGCGGRGKWIANLFKQHGGYQVVAAADYFQDRVDGMGKQFQVESSRCHTGLGGYQKLLANKPDAVVIETPPYFHPQQAMAAVDAGCHVFQAKPLAVDVPGCLTIAEAGKKATQKKLCFLVDFQTRADALYREAVRRVHGGDIGRIVSGEAVYYCGTTWGGDDELPGYKDNPELRLRLWGVDRTLSGDVITEQNIHALDVATWILDGRPLKAYGTGGRKGRSGPGNCYDHFAVIYYFPNDVVLSFSSKQFGSGYDDIGCRVYGPQGTIDTHYFGSVSISGKAAYAGGKMDNLYTKGAVANIAQFHKDVTGGHYSNPTVAPSVRSNLTTILGRSAAYKKGEVTWDEMMKANEKFQFDLAGLKA